MNESCRGAPMVSSKARWNDAIFNARSNGEGIIAAPSRLTQTSTPRNRDWNTGVLESPTRKSCRVSKPRAIFKVDSVIRCEV